MYFLLAHLESANSSILTVWRLFQEVVGKTSEFYVNDYLNASNLIGCSVDC